MKTTKPGGIIEIPKFPCPKWDKVKPQLTFPGKPEEHVEESAREWSSHIKALLKGNARGLTNARRDQLAKLDRQLEAFLGVLTNR